jgi:hypothetical protein
MSQYFFVHVKDMEDNEERGHDHETAPNAEHSSDKSGDETGSHENGN